MRETGKRARYMYVPRSFLVNPDHFGHFEEVGWNDVTTPEERDRLLASQWQHRACLLTRDAMQYRGISVDDLAAATRMKRENLWRLLRGDGPMKLVDFATLERVLGVRLVQPDSDSPRRVGTQVEP